MSEPIDLYELLPEIYRREDARRGYPLKALLAIINEQANVLKDDIDGLWDNFFVETAADWVLPYIGDLVGNTPIHNVVRGRRADVAKTIYYRLRKGTLPMLEELARDITGWSVHAVAFFDILTWTQNMNHLRPSVGTVQLRDIDICDRVHGAFDVTSHTVDIRPTAPAAGWHHIPKVGFFIWRLGSYELTRVQPHQANGVPFGYYFNPLGIPQHLFNSPSAESDETGLASEIHIAQPIRPIAFNHTPGLYYGKTRSLSIHIDGVDQTVDDIVCMDLSTWRQRTDGKIGIDVRNGRFALPAGMVATDIDVSFQYGFSADVGGGSYERRDDDTLRDPEYWAAQNPDEPGEVVYVPTDHPTIHDALAAWDTTTTPRLIIHIEDSRTYSGDITFNQNVTNRPNVQVIIQAVNKQRPMLAGSLLVPGTGNPARVSVKGLLVEGTITVATPVDPAVNRSLDLLEVMHCTLVPGVTLDETLQPVQPGTPSITIESNNDLLDVVVEHSISGPLRIPPDTRSLTITNSIVDNVGSSNHGQVFPAVISGGLNLSDAASALGRPLTIRIGDETHTVRLATVPTTLNEIASALQAAIRAATGASEAFTRACVFRLSGIPRLIVVPGVVRPVRIKTGHVANLLSLTPSVTREISLFISAHAGDLSTLTTPPQLSVVVERADGETLLSRTFDITLPDVPTRLEDVARDLQTALRALPVLAGIDVFVRVRDGRLIAYLSEEDITLRFVPSAVDPISVPLLGLNGSLPAISYAASGLIPGPETTIEESTIIGPVLVRAMIMASNSIFTDTVTCQRRQIGCVRFSYVPRASITPRRYHCQPDQAIEAVSGGPDTDPLAVLAAQTHAMRRVQPEFTTLRYGIPAYAQLSWNCAPEIRTGADNGAEMGVFNVLMQPQREANLRIRFEEYLPFGLEAGLILVN